MLGVSLNDHIRNEVIRQRTKTRSDKEPTMGRKVFEWRHWQTQRRTPTGRWTDDLKRMRMAEDEASFNTVRPESFALSLVFGYTTLDQRRAFRSIKYVLESNLTQSGDSACNVFFCVLRGNRTYNTLFLSWTLYWVGHGGSLREANVQRWKSPHAASVKLCATCICILIYNVIVFYPALPLIRVSTYIDLFVCKRYFQLVVGACNQFWDLFSANLFSVKYSTDKRSFSSHFSISKFNLWFGFTRTEPQGLIIEDWLDFRKIICSRLITGTKRVQNSNSHKQDANQVVSLYSHISGRTSYCAVLLI